jgi:hypothetical protein
MVATPNWQRIWLRYVMDAVESVQPPHGHSDDQASRDHSTGQATETYRQQGTWHF